MKKIILVVLLLSMVGCVPPPTRTKNTSSGLPEAIFVGVDAETVRNKIVQECLDDGKMIEDSSGSQVVCSSEIKGSLKRIDAMLALNGNASSSSPREKTRYIISKIDNGTKVTAQPTIELQMSGGAMRSTSVSYSGALNDIQYFLDTLYFDATAK